MDKADEKRWEIIRAPWKVISEPKVGHSGYIQIVDRAGKRVAFLEREYPFSDAGSMPEIEITQRAHLIASAPEIWRALGSCLHYCRMWVILRKNFEQGSLPRSFDYDYSSARGIEAEILVMEKALDRVRVSLEKFKEW